MMTIEWDFIIKEADNDECAQKIKNLQASFLGWPCHLSSFFGEEAITVEHAKYAQTNGKKLIHRLNLHRHAKLRSQKALKEAVGLGMPMAEAEFMITSKAANTV